MSLFALVLVVLVGLVFGWAWAFLPFGIVGLALFVDAWRRV